MSDLRERLAEVLTRHEDTGYNPDTGQWRCDCGATLPPDGSMATYWYHLADALLPLVRAYGDERATQARAELVARIEGVLERIPDVREFGERGTPFSNGAKHLAGKVRAALTEARDVQP